MTLGRGNRSTYFGSEGFFLGGRDATKPVSAEGFGIGIGMACASSRRFCARMPAAENKPICSKFRLLIVTTG